MRSVFEFEFEFVNGGRVLSAKDNNCPKAETYTFNQVKELLQMHENTLLNVFNSTIDRLDKKIDILKEENSKIKKDLRESVQ